jgi:hypothetical protein
MWYITFHGVGSNYNICAYPDVGSLLTKSVLNTASVPKNSLKKAETRAIGFASDRDFYVVNSRQEVSQILRFSQISRVSALRRLQRRRIRTDSDIEY